jgi:hypothetical protein
MIVLLFLVPILAIATSLFVYQLNGKREIIKLDIVQFFYAFVLAPIMFIWIKSVLFVLLRSELDIVLTVGQMFLVDTFFSLIFIYIFAFVVMHSLTKSINLKVGQDPLHDIFLHSEYFHLWLSHLVIFIGSGLIVSGVSLANVFFPVSVEISRFFFYMALLLSIGAGQFSFLGIWLSDPKQKKAHFLALIKLIFGLLFMLHIFVFFLIRVPFNSSFGIFWMGTLGYASLIFSFLFAHRSRKAISVMQSISDWFKHQNWDKRVQLFVNYHLEKDKKEKSP